MKVSSIMNFIYQLRSLRFVLVFVAIIIAIGSLVISNYLISDLKQEEANRIRIWAAAYRTYNTADEDTDISLVWEIIQGNNYIPIIVIDDESNILSYRNIEFSSNNEADSVKYLMNVLDNMLSKDNVVRIDMPDDLGAGKYWQVCYDESLILKRLNIYPYIQLGVVIIFVLITIFALFATLRSEQNRVWVGLSKETAHQLGTPISSLMAWCEVLKESYPEDMLIPEMNKDVDRLQVIAERFSQIGSVPKPKPDDIVCVIERVLLYMEPRTSNKVKIVKHFPDDSIIVSVIPSLFEWVAENLYKNAVDAMNGSGTIEVTISEDSNYVFVDFCDTGKGIPKKNLTTIFLPGFTTKERGWGLGLSLAKRIIEEYHKGRIFVKSSKVGVGTTFRIELPKL